MTETEIINGGLDEAINGTAIMVVERVLASLKKYPEKVVIKELENWLEELNAQNS